MLRKEVEETDTADWEYQSFIEFTDLPKLIKDLESRYVHGGNGSSDDPQYEIMKQKITTWSKVVQDSNFKDVRAQMQNILDKRNEILTILSSVSPDQRENALKIKNSLVQASQSDDKIFASINPCLEEVNLLANHQLLWSIMSKFQIRNDEPS